MQLTWSEPFYMLTHLEGMKPGAQATCIEYANGCASAFVKLPSDGCTPSHSETFPSAAEARAWCERRVTDLGLLA